MGNSGWTGFPSTLTIPQGAGPLDPRVVIDGTTGRIEIYTTGGVLVGFIDDTGFWSLFGDVTGRYMRLDASSGNAELFFHPDSLVAGVDDWAAGSLRTGFDVAINMAGHVVLTAPQELSVVATPPSLELQAAGLMSLESFAILESDNIELRGDTTVTPYRLGSRVWRDKTADTPRTNQAAMFADPDMVWVAVTPGRYVCDCDFSYFTSNVANDIQFQWTFSGAATGMYSILAPALGAVGGINALNTSEANLGGTTGHGALVTPMRARCRLWLNVTATGDLQLNFNQNPTGAGLVITLAQSTNGVLERIA